MAFNIIKCSLSLVVYLDEGVQTSRLAPLPSVCVA